MDFIDCRLYSTLSGIDTNNSISVLNMKNVNYNYNLLNLIRESATILNKKILTLKRKIVEYEWKIVEYWTLLRLYWILQRLTRYINKLPGASLGAIIWFLQYMVFWVYVHYLLQHLHSYQLSMEIYLFIWACQLF